MDDIPQLANDAASSLPRRFNYLGLLYLKLYAERELVRSLAGSGLLDKLDASQVHSTTSANEERPQRPRHSSKNEENGTALTK